MQEHEGSRGNIYIADTYNGRIRKVSRDGIITTLAGGGFNLGNGLATDRALSHPQGVAVDRVGRVYVSEFVGYVRRITTDGQMVTIAGDGNSRRFFGDGGPAISASLYEPGHLAIDSRGDLYVADTRSARIRKITFPFDLVAVTSRVTHAGRGDSDLLINPPQPADGAIAVEPRALGAARKIVFRFNDPIVNPGIATSDASIGDFSYSGKEVIVTLSGVANASRTTVSLVGVNGAKNTSAVFGSLIGDVNQSGKVTAGDISGVKAHINAVLNKANSVFDLNGDGVITDLDVSLVKAHAGKAIP